jgi:O-antigen biosynthesis protein
MYRSSLLDASSFSPKFLTQRPSAWLGHLPFAAWLIKQTAPKVLVELGTHYGHSYFSFCQSVADSGMLTKCYAVDTWEGDEHAGQYGVDIFAGVSQYNEENYSSFSRLLKMTFDEAASNFADGSVDILHIDGLHTYEAVRHDFETWLPKLSSRAIVVFHDTNVRERNFGVWKFWDELILRYPNNIEFLHSHGLGVLQLNGISGLDTQAWLQTGADDKRNFVKFFSELGSRQIERYESTQLRNQNLTQSQTLFERDAHVKNLEFALIDRDRYIVELNAQKDAQISDRDRQISDRDRQISDRDRQISDRDRQISEMSNNVASLKSALSELGNKNDELRCLVNARDETIGHLNNAVSSRDTHIGLLHRSTSWRITWPLRILMRQVTRVSRASSLLAPAFEHGGGVANTLKKAIHLYRHEGLAGIKRGFRIVATAGQVLPTVNSGEYDRNDYLEWIRRYDTITDETREQIRGAIYNFSCQPLISIVMPVYNPKPEWLIEVIDSVRKQLYSRWELCIADDCSTDKAIRPILEHYAKEDSRIKVVFRESNGHICAASNSALAVADGEWIALLDHDDLLREHALFHVVAAINANPDTRLIYSDEDKVDETGRRYDPYFKSDWNMDLFYSQNMFCHLGVYDAALLREIGGFREGLEGSQDYDLALRCIEKIKQNQIHHIPKVLYHWRTHANSTAASIDAKPYALLAGERALNEHFVRQNMNSKVEIIGHSYRVRHGIPKLAPLVSLIIPTRNALQLTRTCVSSILEKTTYSNYEIIIVDNGSDDPATLEYFEQLKLDPRVSVLRDDRPFNYSALNNAAVGIANGEILGLLNNDLEVISPDWLSEMVSHAIRPEIGAVGTKLWYPDNTVQHAGVLLGMGGVAGHAFHKYIDGDHGYFSRLNLVQNFTAVTAACLIVRKAIYQEVGGLNEPDLQIAFNDVDFCLRIHEAGYRNVWTPYAEMYHHESATRGYEDSPEKVARFNREVNYMKNRWAHILLKDPAYNPNLTLDHSDFSLAWPPRV